MQRGYNGNGYATYQPLCHVPRQTQWTDSQQWSDVKDVRSLQQNKGIRLTVAESDSLMILLMSDTIITHQKWILSSLKILFN